MKILVIGSGGREHALVWKLGQSRHVAKIFCAPGNGGICQMAECVPLRADDLEGLVAFAKKEKVDLTVVGPEAPLVAGIVDLFEQAGLVIFGPSKKAARLEASKSFAKEIMKKCGVPTADFEVCRTLEEVAAATARLGLPLVVKADGLAAGKGVVICRDAESVRAAAQSMLEEKIFGDAGATVVVEKCLTGEEASILVLTDGWEAVPLASSQDHKRIFDKDEGPNTGGMGAYSPAPAVTHEILVTVMNKVVYPVIRGLEKEGALYRGLLYAGIMITDQGPQVLEFNVRFGDPETQAVLARLESDLAEAMLWTIKSGPPKPQLTWSKKVSVCVVASAAGYPGSYEKGKRITGLEKTEHMEDAAVFHAGTKKVGGDFVTDGGRVLGVTALGKDLRQAVDRAYEIAGTIHFEGMHMRRDIGWRAL